MKGRSVANDANPGTGTQYYYEACENPYDHPRFAEEIETREDDLAATQYNAFDRTWQCGGEYWDTELQDIVELDAVVRKSSWCHAGDPEEGSLKFQFVPDHKGAHGHGFEYDPNAALQDESKPDPTERFLPRHNVPFRLP